MPQKTWNKTVSWKFSLGYLAMSSAKLTAVEGLSEPFSFRNWWRSPLKQKKMKMKHITAERKSFKRNVSTNLDQVIAQIGIRIHTPRRYSVINIKGFLSVTAPRNWTILGCLSFTNKLTSCLKSWLNHENIR